MMRCPKCSTEMVAAVGCLECPNCHYKLEVSVVCPDCGSHQLKLDGQPSLLDGAQGWQCVQCGAQLAPIRPWGCVLGLMIFAGAVTLGSIAAIMYVAAAREGFEIAASMRRFWLLFLGPIVGLIVFFWVLSSIYAKKPIPPEEYARRKQEQSSSSSTEPSEQEQR